MRRLSPGLPRLESAANNHALALVNIRPRATSRNLGRGLFHQSCLKERCKLIFKLGFSLASCPAGSQTRFGVAPKYDEPPKILIEIWSVRRREPRLDRAAGPSLLRSVPPSCLPSFNSQQMSRLRLLHQINHPHRIPPPVRYQISPSRQRKSLCPRALSLPSNRLSHLLPSPR